MSPITRRCFLAKASATLALTASTGCAEDNAASAGVSIVRTPHQGMVPAAAVDAAGALRVAYIQGQNLYFVESRDRGVTFGEPVRVNDREGDAQGGLFRGGEMAIGADGVTHIVWYGGLWQQSGDKSAQGALYTRRLPGGRFEPSRNLGREPSDGFSVSAGRSEVVLAWHNGEALKLLRSGDAGASFAAPSPLSGALPCECCDTNLYVAKHGTLVLVYRDRAGDRRDMYLATVERDGRARRVLLDSQSWIIKACPLSSSGLAVAGDAATVAWERDGRVLLARVGLSDAQRSGPLDVGGGKYPIVLRGSDSLLLAWSDGNRLVWQLRDATSLRMRKSGSARRDNPHRIAGVTFADGQYVLFA